MSVLEDIEGLKDARTRKKLSQVALSFKSQVPQGDISKFESGTLSMSRDAAEKMANVLGTNAVTLQFENRARHLVKARDEGDAQGVFNAAKSAVKLLDGLEMDAEDEKALDALVQAALDFAESIGGKGARDAAENAESASTKSRDPYMGGLSSEGRDVVGRRVNKSAATDENYLSEYLHPAHRGSAFFSEKAEEDEAEAYDSMMAEGRDPITGVRIEE
jgi:transcriptional regulator with XRE-family HTH domain